MVLFCVDYGAVVAALLSSLFFRDKVFLNIMPQLQPAYIPDSYIFCLIPIMYLGFILYESLYSKRLPFWQCVEKVFKSTLYATLLTASILYFTGTAKETSRLFILFSWVFSFAYLSIARYVTKRVLLRVGLWQKPVVIVGAGKTAELLAKNFVDEPGMGYKIVGLIEDNYKERPLLREYPHIGLFINAEQAVWASGVQDVIIAAPGLGRKQLLDLVYRIQPHIRNLTIVPDLFGVPVTNMSVETLFNEKAILLQIDNNMMKVRNRIYKRIFDLVASICGTIAISPILFLIAIAIYTSSPGPIIFSHIRIGANGKVFPCYKFRSMVTDAQNVLKQYLANNPAARDEWERDFKLKEDPRITPIGRFLRKTSLDELPQIFNVIKGEMSLVGPRPIIDKEIIKYGEYINDYYLVRPGMTGYWQVSGRSDIDYNHRVRMDSWYVRNWSLWQDIVMLFKTIGVVMGRKGAY